MSAVCGFAADVSNLAAIGFARANGEFTIDGVWTRDNSTVFDGATIATKDAALHVFLGNGARLDLGLDSRGRVFGDHVVVEQGMVQVRDSSVFTVVAGDLRIYSAQQALVDVSKSGYMSFRAVRGAANVTTAAGLLVNSVAAGAMFIERRVTGCLQKVDIAEGTRSGHITCCATIPATM